MFIEMTFEEWEAKYKPIKNHLDKNASFQDESGNGIMFETYGEEVEFVKSQDPSKIWTYGDGDNCTYISNGWHYINRLGYFITEESSDVENDTIQVIVSVDTCEKCGEPYDFPCVEDDGELTCPACCGHEECQ